MSVFTFAEQAV